MNQMLDKIKQLKAEIEQISVSAKEEVEELRIRYISKKGLVGQLFNEFKDVPAEMKKEVGQAINDLKEFAVNRINELKDNFEAADQGASGMDLTAPGEPMKLGSRHPLSVVKNEIIDIFTRLGFTIAEGPEIEDDWHVFSALNFPPEHPARDMQDTFFIEKDPDVLLRTHTSSVQIRVMEKTQPPIRAIFPGRVFRNEAISARSHCIFHQIEGLYVDENVSFADLKQTLLCHRDGHRRRDRGIRHYPRRKRPKARSGGAGSVAPDCGRDPPRSGAPPLRDRLADGCGSRACAIYQPDLDRLLQVPDRCQGAQCHHRLSASIRGALYLRVC
jgi:phenylalanyl-tRNA synthetase alpha subunit